jgi:hypothetical protein
MTTFTKDCLKGPFTMSDNDIVVPQTAVVVNILLDIKWPFYS